MSSLSIPTILRDQMHSVVAQADHEAPAFFVADVSEVLSQLKRWRKALPRVHPFFAIKCNPDPVFMQALAAEGTGFDCASQEEIAAVLQLGVDPSRIIYANPTKQASMVRYASQVGVQMMTFDNAEELHKVAKHHPQADMVLRILVDDSKSICKFGAKFGAAMDSVPSLLKTALDLNISVIGVSFHVGSGCMDAESFAEAVANAKKVFDLAAELGKPMTFLDVGGGFPGSQPSYGSITFEDIAAVLGPAIDKHFDKSVRVIAEPGRYFVSAAMTLATQITSRRTVAPIDGEVNPSYMYYINDGVYGSFNCIMFDHAVVTPRVLLKNNEVVNTAASKKEDTFVCSIWGPTCDSMDCITKEGLLPKLDVGDWLYFDNMGAYTNAAASTLYLSFVALI